MTRRAPRPARATGPTRPADRTATTGATTATDAPLRTGSLADLGKLHKAWRKAEDRRQAEAARARREAEARARAESMARALGYRDGPPVVRDLEADRRLFLHTVGDVHPVADRGLADLDAPLPEPVPRQRELDEQAALVASWSDEVTLEAHLLTDDGMSFRRPGIGLDVLNRLRRGHWALQGQVDLHGLTRDEARDALAAYIRESHRRGLRCVRVVHGKGLGSPGRQPVLKDKVKRWLAQCQEVIAFAQGSGLQGGGGALVVLLAGR